MKTTHKRIISVILALCFCVLLIPNVSGAAVSGADAFVSEVREKMIARETEIKITLTVTQAVLDADYGGNLGAYIDAFYDDLYEGVFAHDGTLKGGDYLRKHTGSSSLGGDLLTFNGTTWNCPLTLTVEYYTTAAQEAELDEKLDGILKAADEDFGLLSLSDYKKIRWAYDYLCSRVSYDNEHLHDDDYLLKYSAYAALVNGTAVCQGYANLFYLMMQRLGVDARIITGWGDGEAHAWNIVKLGNLYYNCDSTWDVGAKTYRYFLRGSKTFENHKADPEFSDKTFTEAFPISETDYDSNHKHKPAPMDPVAAACTEPGSEGGEYCIECGEILTQPTVVPALGHDFCDWIVTKTVTCTENGEESRNCSRCTAVETRPVDALGHDFGDWTVTKTVSCTENGEESRNCSRCTAIETRPVDALGHDFGDWTVTKTVSCTENGEESRNCSRCTAVETRPVDALGHDFGEWIITMSASCTEDGLEVRGCSRCTASETQTVDALGHDFGEWIVTKPASCIEEGVESRGCSRCTASETQTVDALGHDFGDWIVTKPASCIEEGVESRGCSRCTATETRPVDALGHDMNGKTEVITPATATAAGTLRTWCTRCDYFEDSEIAMLDPSDDPTEIKPGDVDGDGNVDTSDARLALRCSIGLEKYTAGSREFIACDVNLDHKVGTDDARFILRHAIGLTDAGIIW